MTFQNNNAMITALALTDAEKKNVAGRTVASPDLCTGCHTIAATNVCGRLKDTDPVTVCTDDTDCGVGTNRRCQVSATCSNFGPQSTFAEKNFLNQPRRNPSLRPADPALPLLSELMRTHWMPGIPPKFNNLVNAAVAKATTPADANKIYQDYYSIAIKAFNACCKDANLGGGKACFP